ncbi:hypothetical protein [Sphingomicrobium aestuariivivum]|uniref:hypothetical protein n=1 Tax=Sphingomicrobium aestuariivivum TaxID=1582356 RepID=UPI001FD6CE16|nr:hypothetical protein [Sphingomicrobium aestuariivivum]MCJ8190171.1 hypothetical protein [Sphingomicrobium aestuariivivum]
MKSKLVKPVVIAACAVSISACAAKPVNMSIGQVPAAEGQRLASLGQTIRVGEISGGKKTTVVAEVSNEDFQAALRQSLANNGLLASSGGDYQLTAELMRIKKPMVMVNAKVTSEVRYQLTDMATGELLMDELVEVDYTQSFGSALLGETRLRKAIEGSVRTNITEFLDRLADQMGDETPRASDGIEISIILSGEAGTFGF